MLEHALHTRETDEEGVTGEPVEVVPVAGGDGSQRGVVVVDGDGVRWVPFNEVAAPERLALAGMALAGLLAALFARRGRGPAVREITMGPGGWVSFKGAAEPRFFGTRLAKGRRPWWAHVLRARRLESRRR
jgi:hypothetical protein